MKAILAAFVLLASGIQSATYDLLWKPKEGQKLSYGLKIDGLLMEQELKITGDVVMHVKKVEANGDYTLGTAMKNMKASFGGHDQAQPDEEEDVQKYNARGDLLSERKKADDPDSDVIGEIFSRVGEYQAPPKAVTVGDKWTHEFPADKNLNLPKAKGTYQLLSDADDKLKILIEYLEESGAEPTSAKGIAVVEKATCTPISLESEVKNLRFQEGVPAGSAKLSMVKKS